MPDFAHLTTATKELGLAVTLCLAFVGFLLWQARQQSKRDAQREERLAARVTRLEEHQATILTGVVADNAKAMVDMAEALRNNTAALQQVQASVDKLQEHLERSGNDMRLLMQTMALRPCLVAPKE